MGCRFGYAPLRRAERECVKQIWHLPLPGGFGLRQPLTILSPPRTTAKDALKCNQLSLPLDEVLRQASPRCTSNLNSQCVRLPTPHTTVVTRCHEFLSRVRRLALHWRAYQRCCSRPMRIGALVIDQSVPPSRCCAQLVRQLLTSAGADSWPKLMECWSI